jgi:hypothetical protein
MRKLVNGLIGLLVLAFLGWVVATPWLAAQDLAEAAERGDARALERRVDFPKLRDSLKEELNARMADEVRARSGSDRLAGLGALFGPALISGAVDALVTPQAVSAMVQTGEAPKAPGRGDSEAEVEAKADTIERTLGYRDLNTFAIGFRDTANPDDRSVTLLMKRRGFFDWKLEAVELPRRDDAAN